MVRGSYFLLGLIFFLSLSAAVPLLIDQRRDAKDDTERNKAILEMLHIQRVSGGHRGKPHPYMTRVYQRLDSLEAQGAGRADGTLVQSLRSSDGPDLAPPGWIWFNVSALDPSLLGAELVLFRKTLNPHPLSVTVALHSVAMTTGALTESPALEERLLTLDRRPSSGYDVFNVSAVLALRPLEAMGFQLRYTDQSGSLVLHEALTQSLYCVNRSDPTQPLLVLYQSHPRLV